MFGNIYKSCISISNFLWEPVGVVFVIALAFLFWDKKRFWKDPLFITLFTFSLFLLAWRIYIHASGRYFSITVLPVLLIIFNFIRRVPFPKAIRCFLLAGAIFACLCRDMRGNPYESDLIELYRKTGTDANLYGLSRLIGFTSQGGRQTFYSGKNVSVTGLEIPNREIINSLRGNLDFFHGICDVLYIFVSVKPSDGKFVDEFCNLMPDNSIKLFGRCFIDRSRKKEIVVFKYETGKNVPKSDDETFKLMDNGDFSQIRTGENAEKYNLRLARRAPRFGKEQPVLPEKYNIYHSLTAFSNSIANIEKRQGHNVLRVQANGSYLGVITPQIDMRKERYISFNIKVNRKSSLQINRNVAGKGMFPFFTVDLDPAPEKRCVLRLESSGANGDVWFWLNEGDIELSNLRIK